MKSHMESGIAEEIAGLLEMYAAETRSLYVSGDGHFPELPEKAAFIREAVKKKAPDESSVCLCTEDRGFIMAAILAALSGGPDLILPHVLTDQVIMNACAARKTQTVLSEKKIKLPGGLKQIIPADAVSSAGRTGISRDIHAPFLWLYSGGSTGMPIIWPKTPMNLLGEAIFLKDHFKITRDDIILASVSPRHIYGLLFSVLLPFVAQAGVVNDSPVFPAEVSRSALSSKATVYVGAPLHYKGLAAGSPGLKNIRLAFSSGGFLDKVHSLAFSGMANAPVEEVYGSTETGGIANRSIMRGETGFKAFPVVRLKIEENRLCVKSPFISPGLPLDGDGYFRTGDRVGGHSEGVFELSGRVDNVVKVGGNRVELDAVEQKLRALESITDIFIFQVSAKQGRDNEVSALVVSNADIKELKRLFRKALNPVEMPRYILKVDTIPLTPAGKRDAQAALSLVKGRYLLP
jgi:acyl-coenzyme A synthetase/AMP-(fatty) acid ligase